MTPWKTFHFYIKWRICSIMCCTMHTLIKIQMWSWRYKTKINVISQCSSKHAVTIYESSFLVMFFLHSKAVQAPISASFTTSPPIIAIFTLSAQGFLRPFEKENPFCYRRDWEGERGKGISKERGRAGDLARREKHVSRRVTAFTHISASLQLQACSSIHPNNCLPAWVGAWVAQLFKEGTNWQWDLWFERKEAVCRLVTHWGKKKSLENPVQFTNWSQSEKNKWINTDQSKMMSPWKKIFFLWNLTFL